jgi:hypothetical protein
MSWNNFLVKIEENNKENIKKNAKIVKNSDLFPYSIGRVLKFIEDIPQMSKNKIVSKLEGAEDYLLVELDNGHLLKLFVEGPEDSGFLAYQKLQDRLYSGKSGKHDPIYDLGMTPFGVKYVELSSYISFAKWSKDHSFNNDDQGLMRSVQNIIEFVLDNAKELFSPDIFPEERKETIDREAPNSYSLSQEQRKNLISAILQYVRTHGEESLEELHAEDLSISKQNPDMFIFHNVR